MKKSSHMQRGFAPLLILLGVVLIGGLGLAVVKSGAIQKKGTGQQIQPSTNSNTNVQPPVGNGNTGNNSPQTGTGNQNTGTQTGSTNPPVNPGVQPSNSSFCTLNPTYCSGTAINTQLLCGTNPAYCAQYGLYPGLNYIPGYTNSLNQEQLRLQQEWYARQQQNLQLQQQQQLQQQIIQQQMQQQQLQQNPYQYNPQTNPYSGVPGYPR